MGDYVHIYFTGFPQSGQVSVEVSAPHSRQLRK